LRRLVVGIGGGCTSGRAHINRVVIVLDRKRNTVQRPYEFPRAGKVRVLGSRNLQCVRHFRIVVGPVGLRALSPNTLICPAFSIGVKSPSIKPVTESTSPLTHVPLYASMRLK